MVPVWGYKNAWVISNVPSVAAVAGTAVVGIVAVGIVAGVGPVHKQPAAVAAEVPAHTQLGVVGAVLAGRSPANQ